MTHTESNRPPAPDGVVLGQYRFISRLGEGAGGETWRAAPLDGGREVAIKVVAHSGLRTRSASDLLREAALLQGIRHPHVVRYLGIVDLPHSPSSFLIMEYVEGGNLADLIAASGWLPLHDIRALVLQVADALSFLHAAGVLHRDLKPANVLVRPIPGSLPILLVADFGISRPLIADRAGVTSPAGTPGYAPPEAWRGEEMSTAADVFSLGAICWHLLSGAYPLPMALGGAPDPAKLAQILHDRRGMSVNPLVELTMRMLDESPRRRPTLREIRSALAPPAPARSSVDPLKLTDTLDTWLPEPPREAHAGPVLRLVPPPSSHPGQPETTVIVDEMSGLAEEDSLLQPGMRAQLPVSSRVEAREPSVWRRGLALFTGLVLGVFAYRFGSA